MREEVNRPIRRICNPVEACSLSTLFIEVSFCDYQLVSFPSCCDFCVCYAILLVVLCSDVKPKLGCIKFVKTYWSLSDNLHRLSTIYFVCIIFLKHKFDRSLISFYHKMSVREIVLPMSHCFNNGTSFFFNGRVSSFC